MHGGAEGSGAPFGNQNALKHGRFTYDAIAKRKAEAEERRKDRERRAEVKEARRIIKALEGEGKAAKPTIASLEVMQANMEDAYYKARELEARLIVLKDADATPEQMKAVREEADSRWRDSMRYATALAPYFHRKKTPSRAADDAEDKANKLMAESLLPIPIPPATAEALRQHNTSAA